MDQNRSSDTPIEETERALEPRPAISLASGPEGAVDPNALQSLCELGRRFYQRGWCDATSGNYSLVNRRDPLRLILTASGYSKGSLDSHRFVLVDDQGHALPGSVESPSAETKLHVVIAQETDAGCILHTHSIWGTLLSDLFLGERALMLEGFEMLKALDGVNRHDQQIPLAIFPNTQDMESLGADLRARMRQGEKDVEHAFLIHHHGLYTWGRTLADAERQVEGLEFIFEVLGRRLSMSRPDSK